MEQSCALKQFINQHASETFDNKRGVQWASESEFPASLDIQYFNVLI